MKKIVDTLKDRLFSILGLDFEVDFQDEFFSRIADDLYLGSRPRPEQIDALKKEGITHIVSCLNLEKKADVEFLKKDFQTIFLPLRDGIHEDITVVLPGFFEFINEAKASSQQAKILVHCEVGVSRSASCVLALLMVRERMSFFEAYIQLRSKRAKVLPNIGFASQLQRLEHTQTQELAITGRISSLANYLHQICNVPIEIEVLQEVLEAHDFNALPAIHAVFGEDIPRVIQGVRI